MTASLPPAFHDDWIRAGSRRDTFSVLICSIDVETTLYEHRETPPIGDCDIQPRSLLQVDLDLSPPLSALGVDPADAFSLARGATRDRFVSMLEDEGVVVEGQTRDLAFDRGDGVGGTWYVFETTHPVGEVRLATETHLAVWPTPKRFAMAGGTLPLEGPAGANGAASFPVGPDDDREALAAFVRARARASLESDETDPSGCDETVDTEPTRDEDGTRVDERDDAE